MKNLKKIVTVGMLIFLAGIIVFSSMSVQAKKKTTKVKLSAKKITMYVGDKEKLSLKNNTKKVKWSTSNKKIVSLSAKTKKSVKLKAKKRGKATVTAKIGKKKYTCKISVYEDEDATPTPTATPVSTGSIKGNVTWQYNKYIGTKADTGAYVALIPPDNTSLKGIDHKNFSLLMLNTNDGIYTANVDGFGQYVINNVPVGQYQILVVSKNTTSGVRFENADTWETAVNGLFSSFLSDSELENIKVAIGYKSYNTSTVEIKSGQETTYSYDFGYTYI
jgi:hypothetical protein